jgi:hypothetical protein
MLDSYLLAKGECRVAGPVPTSSLLRQYALWYILGNVGLHCGKTGRRLLC